MEVSENFEELPQPAGPCVVTIGSFDGLHLGHQLLIGWTKNRAREKGYRAAVLTFQPHPAKVLAPQYSPPLLMSHRQKMRALAGCGLDLVLAQRFDQRFAGLSAEDFARRVLAGGLGVREAAVGDDFTFGRDRKGSAEELRELGAKFGFSVEVVRRLAVEGMTVSSTRIRSFLLQGNVHAAALLLGRPYLMEGQVVSGAGRGHRLGYPTANLKTDAEILPARGVYLCHFWAQGFFQGMLGVANVGTCPTFGPGELGVEVHVLRDPGNLLWKQAAVGFLERLRSEQVFASAEALADQIGRDVLEARKLGTKYAENPTLSPFHGIQLDSKATSQR